MLNGLRRAAAGALGAALIMVLVSVGVVEFSLPDAWSPATVARTAIDALVDEDASLRAKEPVTIVRVEAIALDCRARVQATVPVEGTRSVEFAGMVVRTDTVRIDAQGDVDTCVDADEVEIRDVADGTFLVDVPGDAIRFVRPRVDLVAGVGGVEYDKGFIGEVTDLLPGVSDGDSMIPSALAFAQQVIGGNACMTAAFDVTSQAIRQAYVDQLAAQGVSADQVEVRIGVPDFDQNRLPDETGEIEFAIGGGGIRCTLASGAHDGVSPDWDVLSP